MDKKDFPEVMGRMQAAEYLGMTDRNLSRLIKTRLTPFLRIFYGIDFIKGRILFSKKKLDDYERRFDEICAKFPKEKSLWYLTFSPVIDAERDEQVLAIKLHKLSDKLKGLIDEREDLSGGDVSEMFSDYQDALIELNNSESQRIREFFGDDEEVLFKFFPETFSAEIKAKKEAEAKQAEVKEMHGGVPLQRYESKPGTLKEKKQSIQVEQSQADEGRMVYHREEEEE